MGDILPEIPGEFGNGILKCRLNDICLQQIYVGTVPRGKQNAIIHRMMDMQRTGLSPLMLYTVNAIQQRIPRDFMRKQKEIQDMHIESIDDGRIYEV